MSRYYDKDELKEKLELEQIYDLVEAWGGEPEYTDGGLISQTICHNLPGEVPASFIITLILDCLDAILAVLILLLISLTYVSR